MGGAIVTLSLLPQFAAGTAPQQDFAAVRRWADEQLSELAQALELRRAPAAISAPPESLAAAAELAEPEPVPAQAIARNELQRFRRQLQVLHDAALRLGRAQPDAAR
jgi:hypothetical protein